MGDVREGVGYSPRSDRTLPYAGSAMTTESLMSILGMLAFVAFLGRLWVRDRLRKQVCKAADQAMRAGPLQKEWIETYDILLHSRAVTARIGLTQSCLVQLPQEVRLLFARYSIAQKGLIYSGVALVLVFSAGLVARVNRG